MIYLYITRHGMTKWNEEGRLQGHGDSPLVQQGKEDAEALSQLMHDYPISRIYASPLKRAHDTAQIIFPNRNIILDDRLKEMSFGDFEGGFVKDLIHKKEYDDLWNHPEDFNGIPNGETFDDVYQRLYSFLNEMKQINDEQHIFITIHGMLYVLLMSIIKNIPVNELTMLNREIIRGGALTIVEIHHGHYCIVKEAYDDHLKPTQTISYTKKEA